MKLFLLSSAFYPEISPRAFRATELAKALAAQGHKVTVFTPQLQGVNYAALFPGIAFYFVITNPFAGIQLSGINGLVLLVKRIVSRLLLILFEYPAIGWFFVYKKQIKQFKEADAIISFAVPYPVHWAVAYGINKLTNIAKPVWIADCGDPYMGQQNDTFKPAIYFKYIEKWFCSKADFITVPTSTAVNGYYQEFHSKIKVIPQGFNFNEIDKIPESQQYQKLVFGYGGVFMPGKRDPRPFLDFLTQQSNIAFEFHIYTTTPQLIQDYAKADERIRLFKPVPRNELLTEFSKMAFVVNFENAGQVQTPSKLIDYAIIDKPILSIASGVKESPIWYEFLQRDFTNSYKVENVNQYRIENVAKKFVDLIEEKRNQSKCINI